MCTMNLGDALQCSLHIYQKYNRYIPCLKNERCFVWPFEMLEWMKADTHHSLAGV